MLIEYKIVRMRVCKVIRESNSACDSVQLAVFTLCRRLPMSTGGGVGGVGGGGSFQN